MDAGLVLGTTGTALSAIALAHGATWTLFSALALRPPRPAGAAATPMRFTVIVPAHNEQASIARTVASLRDDRFEPMPRIVVVADNCTDETAATARAAGANVLARDDEALRGKSFALDFAILHCEKEGSPPDAYVVVDADTVVERGFFAAMAAALWGGASVAQARYDVAAPVTDLAKLRALAFSLVHYARPQGASRLGLGMGLKGNGMAFRRDVVAGGIPGAGLAEDASATLALAAQGRGVCFVPGAVVRGEMAGGYAAASAQDRRWEGGRLALVPRAALTGLGAAARGRWAAAGSALDVAALPLSLVLLVAAAGTGFAIAGEGSLPLALAAATSVAVYPPIGWAAAKVPRAWLGALGSLPRFLFHKFATLARLAISGAPRTWERTTREVQD